jgi:hypothetical protein
LYVRFVHEHAAHADHQQSIPVSHLSVSMTQFIRQYVVSISHQLLQLFIYQAGQVQLVLHSVHQSHISPPFIVLSPHLCSVQLWLEYVHHRLQFVQVRVSPFVHD